MNQLVTWHVSTQKTWDMEFFSTTSIRYCYENKMLVDVKWHFGMIRYQPCGLSMDELPFPHDHVLSLSLLIHPSFPPPFPKSVSLQTLTTTPFDQPRRHGVNLPTLGLVKSQLSESLR